MRITIKFRASLKKYSGTEDGSVCVEVPEGTSIKDILEMYKIPPYDVGMMMVNNEVASKETILQPDDTLELFTMLKGG